MFTRMFFTSIPWQKFTIFFTLSFIIIITDGCFVLSILFAFLGKILLYIILCWYISCAIMNKFINKNNVIGQINKRAVIITGCDRGFGYLTALRFNELGFHTIATCLDAQGEGAEKLRNSCRNTQRIHIMQLDVTNQQQIDQLVQQVRQLLKDKQLMLHALINNAGIGWSAPAEYGDYELAFGKILNVNGIAPVQLTRKFLPLMRESQKNCDITTVSDARVINICSQASNFHTSPIGSYCMSKAMLLAFTNALRQELDELNIRAISIEPSFFKTEIVSIQAAKQNITHMLRATEPEVLHAYGVEFSKLRLQPVIPMLLCKELNLVVDSIVDAAMAIQPEMRYTVAGLEKSLLILFSYFPTDIIYTLLKLANLFAKLYVRLFKHYVSEQEIENIHAEKEKLLSL